MSKTEYRAAERTGTVRSSRPAKSHAATVTYCRRDGLGRNPNRGRLRFSATRFILTPLGAQRWETDARAPIDMGHSVLHAEANPGRIE